MVTYKCQTCNKEFKQKCDYDRHINKKFPCQNEAKNSHDEPKLVEMSQKKEKNVFAFPVQELDVIQCNYCNRLFTLKSSLNKHLKDRCKIKKEDTNTKEEIYQSLLKQMKELEENNKKQLQIIEENSKKRLQIMEENNKKLEENQKQLMAENKQLKKEISIKKNSINGNNINSNNTTNTTNNTTNNTNNQQNNIKNLQINLIAHGKEDLSFITEDRLKKILYKGFKSIENLTEIVHFDKNRPQNHNVYISNIKDSYVMM